MMVEKDNHLVCDEEACNYCDCMTTKRLWDKATSGWKYYVWGEMRELLGLDILSLYTPLSTSHNCSPKWLLFIFPYCHHLPPCTSSTACACFHLSCHKSSQIKVATLQKNLDLLVHEHHTQMALTLQFISTLLSQIASIAIVALQFTAIPKCYPTLPSGKRKCICSLHIIYIVLIILAIYPVGWCEYGRHQ